jgi:hypothetical protein
MTRSLKTGADFWEATLPKPFAPVDLARAAKKALYGSNNGHPTLRV